MQGRGVTMADLARPLKGLLGQPVFDRTGVTGLFDVDFRFARDSSLTIGGPADGQANLPGLPNIFTAIRSIGLRLEAGKELMDRFFVDGMQKPTSN